MGALLLAAKGQLTIACGLIFLAALFDVADGWAARVLGGGSPLGAQLDSLADMVSFGVAPAFVLYTAHEESAAVWQVQVAALVLPISSAWRLAKFNLDTRQTHGFLGLPTPANALFWAGALLAAQGVGVTNLAQHYRLPHLLAQPLVEQPNLTLALALLLGTLMLSELALPSLKTTHSNWKGNEVLYLLLALGAALFALYGTAAVPLVLALYLLSPLWGRSFQRKAARRH
jgi:CDP-diacylglycerol---serine O-phosphatidyltransferase